MEVQDVSIGFLACMVLVLSSLKGKKWKINNILKQIGKETKDAVLDAKISEEDEFIYYDKARAEGWPSGYRVPEMDFETRELRPEEVISHCLNAPNTLPSPDGPSKEPHPAHRLMLILIRHFTCEAVDMFRKRRWNPQGGLTQINESP